MWTRSRFLNEYVPGLFTVALDAFITQRNKNKWDQLFTVKDSMKKREQDSIRSRLGRPVKKGEGAPVGYDVQIEGPLQTWVPDVWALGVRITEEAIDDNLYHLRAGGNADELKEIFEDLGFSLADNPEIMAAQFFNSATATTYHKTRFATAFASATQYRLDGSTYSNLLTPTDLTYSTFWAALIAAENQYDHRQNRIIKKVKGLWHPPQLEKNAVEILKSTDRPDTANRAINAYAKSGRSVTDHSWAYMTNANAWVLQMEGRGLISFWRATMRGLTNLQIAAQNVIGGSMFPFDSPGSHFYVDPVYGSDDNSGESFLSPFKTIKKAYDQCTTLKNDVVHLMGSATAYAQAAVLTFDKDYTHIVAHTAPIRNGGRARITNTVATATAGEFVISGTGCVFVNLHFQFGASATATSLVGLALSGNGRNAFINCEFEGPLDAGIGAAASQRMLTITSSQDNYFLNCSFGQRTIINTSATGAIVSFNGSNNDGNVFERCNFHLYNSNTASAIINYVDGAMAASGYTQFIESAFMNHHTAAIADIIRNTTNAAGMVLLQNCPLSALTATPVWATNLKTNIFISNAAGAATGGRSVNP